MPQRHLRIVKADMPMIGICEACNSQFNSIMLRLEDATREVQDLFDVHECKPQDEESLPPQD